MLQLTEQWGVITQSWHVTAQMMWSKPHLSLEKCADKINELKLVAFLSAGCVCCQQGKP